MAKAIRRRNQAEELRRKRIMPERGLVIEAGWQGDGGTYGLFPWSEERIRQSFPDAVILDDVFLGYDQTRDSPRCHRPYWQYVALMLTGLSPEQIGLLGGISIYDSTADVIVWEWRPEVARRA